MPTQYASFSRRLFAFGLDTMIYLFILAIIAFFFIMPAMLLGFLAAFSQITATIFAALIWALGLALIATSHWLFYAGCECSLHQTTPGKALMKLKVQDYAGRRLSFRQASVRHLYRVLSLSSLGTGYVLSLFTSRRQTLHDILAKTLVLHRGLSSGTDLPIASSQPISGTL